MKLFMRGNLLFLLIFLGIFISCTKSGCKREEKSAPQAVAVKEDSPQITRFDSLNIHGLTSMQEKSLVKLFNDEICPCGCPKTFAQCLQMEQGCKPGLLLGQWAVDQMKEGAPERFLYQALSEEINAGFLNDPISVKTMGAHSKGKKNAKIVIIEFADFECPACKMAAQQMRKFVKANKDQVELHFMHLPLSAHPFAERAAVAAEAAGKQGKFWKMHDLLFDFDGKLNDAVVLGFAQQIFNPIQLKQFEKDLEDEALLKKVRSHREYAINDLKLMATPSILFNGRPYNLSLARDGFELRMAMENARSDINCQASK